MSAATLRLFFVALSKADRAARVAAAQARSAEAEQKRRDAKTERDAKLAERRAASKKRGR